MSTVTITTDFQVSIPESVRSVLGLAPRQRLQAFAVDGRLLFVPVKRPEALRGIARGIDTAVTRSDDLDRMAQSSARVRLTE
ncbi:hypothetical protein Strain138_001757 [Pseudogemmatithrix spongiicola]|uniref:SpoVT-AbrB domain-containing protein n=1 Tax=Pseudogemmatithrix spongiicola TaxID=3062599 RepID=A0AA49Q827_9BACT|nr:hypothetical protein Strain138_001757 [Gemmatimonadaceae bacterium 'strain 138']WKW15371.1 hypothetical protein Strain318_001756 [Gemmatimonadaceae bacterium 'strain 318']